MSSQDKKSNIIQIRSEELEAMIRSKDDLYYVLRQ